MVDAHRIVVEVDRVDVLVLLRRILGVRDGAVDAGGEPLGMLGDPGVVRGRLQREVQRDLEAQVLGLGDEAVEGVPVAEVGVQGVVSAGGVADGPGRARVLGGGVQGVVLALLERVADRVDRREVDDVEAHGRDLVEAVVAGVEGARDPVAVGIDVGALAAGEELVPLSLIHI